MKRLILAFALSASSLSLLAQAPKVTILEQNTLVKKEEGRYPIGQLTRNGAGGITYLDGMKELDRYIAWGTAAWVGDELWFAYSGDRDAHVCPWGVSHLIKSRDGGKTWSDPETINNTPLDDRDCGLMVTKKGTVILTWFTSIAYAQEAYQSRGTRHYLRHFEKIPQETIDHWLGNWIVRTEDGGKTWSEPIKVSTTSPHGPIQLKNGQILSVGIAYIDNQKCVGVETSKDDGKTWSIISTIPIEGFSAGEINEPHVVENSDGTLVALLRYEPSDSNCVLLQSESKDGGKTWTQAHKTDIWGYPPHILKMHDGTLVMTYGYRKAPFGERAAISRDGGKTWSEPIMLADALNGDLGYPSSVELKDGSILTFYYQEFEPGSPTAIFSTHWRLD